MELMNEYATPAMVRTGKTSVASDQEASWISACQHGDAMAFNRLVLKWEKTVYNIALRLLVDREEASEATQEVFLLTFKNIRRFRRDSKFSTWLYRIALNHCLTRLKQRPPGTYLSLEDQMDTANPAPQLRVPETQVSELVRREERQMVLKALSHLPPEQKAVIELKFFQELKFEEIAAILEIPLSTIKSRLYTGMETLKIRLEAQS